ncbi:hypothetical protein ACG33_08710 [Steroidobacter denitrificans]|uniref:Acyl-coenzyme A thioesterase THEM4 n=1 Tax=Steroidobacter denitrificans TaxID=465721 RepID=A0A127F9S6_STEDE|nr:PaaI family thioesterase [Steroidobacter denitrificans]AMN47174.1 hypothetical protein ACG33_08710 [Steroidobacter denitrificans]
MNEPLDGSALSQYFLLPTDASEAPVTGIWAERRRLASIMRTVIEHLTVADTPESELREAADTLQHLAAQLGAHPRRRKRDDIADTATPMDKHALIDFSPLIGLSNPISPPLELTLDGNTLRGRLRFGTAYEGPPGCAHGGCIAAVFDELLGYAQSLTSLPGMTGTLTIRYRVPTPLHTELHCEARVQRISGRKIFCVGRLYAGETLCAEADGVFLASR